MRFTIPARGQLTLSFAVLTILAATAQSQLSAAPAVEEKKNQGTAESEPRTKMALKLAGLVAFVANSCPELRPDYARFRAALGALGTNAELLEKPGMKSGYIAYTAQYRTDVPRNCARALDEFGPAGKTIPGIFGRS